MHGLDGRSQWILNEIVLDPAQRTALLKYLIFVGQPHEGAQYLIWTLNVGCLSVKLVVGQRLLGPQSHFVDVEHLLLLLDGECMQPFHLADSSSLRVGLDGSLVDLECSLAVVFEVGRHDGIVGAVRHGQK